MTPRLCYPMDVPRGALLVHEGAPVVDVRWRVEDREVDLVVADDDGLLRVVSGLPFDTRVEIDEATPERQARLAAARAILGETT